MLKRLLRVFCCILKGVWRVLRFIFLLIFGRLGLTLLLLLLLADFWLEFHGIPGRMLSRIQKPDSGMLVTCRWIHVGVFKGVTLHNVAFDVNTKAGPLVVHARKIGGQLDWLTIFGEQDWIPDSVSVSGVTMKLMGNNGKPVMDCRVDDGMLRFEGNDLLRLVIDGESQSVKFNVEGTFTSMREFLSELDKSGGPVMPDPDLSALFEKIGQELREFGRLSDDSFVKISLDTDCKDWLSGRMKCRFSLSDLLFNGVVVSKIRGRFEGGMDEIAFDGLDVILSRSEMINGKGMLYPKSRELEATLKGSLAPATLCQLAKIDTKDWLTHRIRIPSLSFEGRLPRCPLELEKMEPSLTCSLSSSFEAFGVDVEKGGFKLSYKDGKLSVDDISFVVSKDGRENLNGKMSLDLNTMQLAGELDGQVIWMERMKNYGIHLPEKILAGNGDPSAFHIKLDPSPLNLRGLSLSGRIEDGGLSFLTRSCREMDIDFALKDGKISIEPLSINLLRVDHAIDVKISCDIDGGLNSGQFKTNFDINALARPDAKSELKSGLACKGWVSYRPKDSVISVECDGDCHPDWIYQSYCRRLDLNCSYVFVLLGTTDKPVKYELKLPEVSLDNGDDWEMTAKVTGHDMHFSTFKVKDIACEVAVNSHEVNIKDIRARTLEDENLRLDIRVQYSPVEFSIKDLELEGNPALAEAFILNSGAQEVYRRIWSEVKWSDKKKPMVRMPTLIYKDGSPWNLTLTAHVNAQDVNYHGYRAEEMNLIVALDLPSTVSVKPITLKTQKGDVYGEISLTFGGVPQCTFKIDGEEGYLNPKTLLTTVNPDFAKTLADISFSDESRLSLTGEMFLSGDSRLSVSGTLACPDMKWRDYELTNMESTWSYSSNGISWNITDATYLEGKLRSSGVYEPDNNRGEFLVFIDGMPFSRVGELAKSAKSDEPRGKPMPGIVNGECHGRFLVGWAGRPLHLEGDGHVSIRQADLWNVPLLAQLSELLPGGNGSGSTLGSITQLDADVEFLGNRLSVPNLYTNGTIMSLRAKGEYGFENESLQFLVSGVPLQDVGIVSLLLRPLSWAFQAELEGTLSAHRWRMKSGLMQLIK